MNDADEKKLVFRTISISTLYLYLNSHKLLQIIQQLLRLLW